MNVKLKKDLQRIVQNTGEPVEQIGRELIVSYLQRHATGWGEEEIQYLKNEVETLAASVLYPQIQPRDPFAPDVPRTAPQEGTHDPVTGEPLQNPPHQEHESGEPLDFPAPSKKPAEGPIPGLSFVKPTGEELEGYNKEYEERLYGRLKSAIDSGDWDKVNRLHKMLVVLVSGETSKKREEYTNKLLDYLNEATTAGDTEKAAKIKEMLSTLHLSSSWMPEQVNLKFS